MEPGGKIGGVGEVQQSNGQPFQGSQGQRFNLRFSRLIDHSKFVRCQADYYRRRLLTATPGDSFGESSFQALF